MVKIKHPKVNKSKKLTTPHDVKHRSAMEKKPVFSFQHLSSDFCISKCDKNEKAALADRLRILSQSTWQQLHQLPRHGQGYEKISRDAITAPIPDCITPDDTILAFRFQAKKPMVGFRDGNVFHIVWFDRDFSLYDHH